MEYFKFKYIHITSKGRYCYIYIAIEILNICTEPDIYFIAEQARPGGKETAVASEKTSSSAHSQMRLHRAEI